MSSRICTRLVIGPNASLSTGQAWAFMALLGTVSLGIGVFFAVQGFWPILPFAGLELVAVAAALIYSLRRNAYREVLSFEEETIGVAFGEVGRGAAVRLWFTRDGSRVLVKTGPHRNSPNRLLLCCQGQTIELGRGLTDEERVRIAVRMRQLIHPGWPGGPVPPADDVTDWVR